jgi:hypothetical protein
MQKIRYCSYARARPSSNEENIVSLMSSTMAIHQPISQFEKQRHQIKHHSIVNYNRLKKVKGKQ